MAGDKGTRRKRLRKLPERIQRLMAFGVFAASFEIPPDKRAEEMVAGLQWLVDLLHREGYAAPRWLLRPFWYFRRGLEVYDAERGERPTASLMLGLFEGLVVELPEAEQLGAMQTMLYFFAGMYDAGGVERPEWLQLGLDRYGEEESEELPVDVMLDVIDASVLNIREEYRATARRSILEHYEAMYRGGGVPVPEWVRVGLERPD